MNNRTIRRAMATAALGSSIFFAAGTGLAGAAEIPAPTGSATGAALDLGPVAKVSATSATADGSGGSAGAIGVEVLGSQVVGGSQTGTGTSSDSLLDTGDTPLGRVQVAPWDATVANGPTSRSASSDAAAARVTVIDTDTATLDVLQSSSSARHTSAASSGSASSDGVVLTLGGDTRIVLLHSESGSAGAASWVADLGGTHVVEQNASGACVIDLTPLLGLACVDSAGGLGALSAGVLRLEVPGVLSASGVTATTSGGSAVTVADTATAAVLAADDSRGAGAAVAGVLARTGTTSGLLVLLALASMLVGSLLVISQRLGLRAVTAPIA